VILVKSRPCIVYAVTTLFLLTSNGGCRREGSVTSRAPSGEVPSGRAQTAETLSFPGGGRAIAHAVPCRHSGVELCFRDTAQPPDVPATGDGIPLAYANWIWFGSAGDSLEFALDDVDSGTLTSSIDRVPSGPSDSHPANRTPTLRPRLTSDGVITVEVGIDPGAVDTASYTLVVRRVLSSGVASLSPTGAAASLSLRSASSVDRVPVIPLSAIPLARDRTRWTVFSKTYRVALTHDSLYEVCGLPCSHPDTVKLLPASRVTKIVRR
jgi:hypothetical protein